MKNILTLAIILTSATAFATRSRMASLGNSPHLTDINTIYGNPADLLSHKDSLTLETGKSNLAFPGDTSTSAGAEGLLIRSMGDAKMGLSLGHDNGTVFTHRSLMITNAGNNTGVLTQQNPFALMYGSKAGDMDWGASLEYSNHVNKLTGAEAKESSMALNFGARTSMWDAAVNVLLTNAWENGTEATVKNEFKGNSGFAISGGYNVASDLYVYGNITSGGFKSTITTANVAADGVAYDQMDYKLGVVSTVKQDANEFFYGVALASTSLNQKTTGIATAAAKSTTMTLPLIIGMEADAASWLTLRGSVTQTVLINDDKVSPDVGNPSKDLSPGNNNTKFAAGAGLKLNAVTLDGSILTGGSQNLNAGAGNLLAEVGLTYNF
jgi:hypothetical protein